MASSLLIGAHASYYMVLQAIWLLIQPQV